MNYKAGQIIPIIDLFAGPGGLGEGFSQFKDELTGHHPFRIALSVEKNEIAHRTLTLRSFYRTLKSKKELDDYYSFLRGDIPTLQALYDRHQVKAQRAKIETGGGPLELREANRDAIDELISLSLKREGVSKNIPWIIIGGPPCQAYSIVGRARRTTEDRSVFEQDPRLFLYREYMHIVHKFQPPVFVMENVEGILSAKIGGERIFPKILNELQKDLGEGIHYRIRSFVVEKKDGIKDPEYLIKAEKYGIPQTRHRVILFGIRSDVNGEYSALSEAIAPTVGQILGPMPQLRSRVSQRLKTSKPDTDESWLEILNDFPLEAVEDEELRKEIRRNIDAMPGRIEKIAAERRKETAQFLNVQPNFETDWFKKHPEYRKWYEAKQELSDGTSALGGIVNHSARGHFDKDLYRYLFVSCFALTGEKKKSPTMNFFPNVLLPAHKNVDEAVKGKKFADRFRVQLKGEPSKTITSHICKDGHYFIHYDPAQCRSLTVREAARLQTFPDDYFFQGEKTDQFHQVGNAVPPLLANKLAEKVFSVIKTSKFDHGEVGKVGASLAETFVVV